MFDGDGQGLPAFVGESENAWEKSRGPVVRKDGRICIGKVAAPPGQEATSSEFHFWVPNEALVEVTQIVTVDSHIGERAFTQYAVVTEVHRSSQKRTLGEEVNEHDGVLDAEPPYGIVGVTYATATVLRAEPAVLTPPRERSDVLLAGAEDAKCAYGADQIERPLPIGLIKNGGDSVVGQACVDLDFILGANGGGFNVNGTAGRGTKSSLLMTTNYMLLHEARRQQETAPSDPSRLRIVPIVFNVKGFDLFHIHRPSVKFIPDQHLGDWVVAGVADPGPFQNVTYLVPQQPGNSLPVATGGSGHIGPYSWSLGDVMAQGLLEYLFAETDAANDNFGALVGDIEAWLTHETVGDDGTVTRALRASSGIPCSFIELRDWVRTQSGTPDAPTQSSLGRVITGHTTGTWKMLYRRLAGILHAARGVLRREDTDGNPLDVRRADTTDPIVIDLNALEGELTLQRFVVAAVLRQITDERTGTKRIPGLVYVVTLDELNLFAPRGSRDPVTRLFEKVASQMRSQGIILFGAQQQASRVSEIVFENASLKAVGMTGAEELSKPCWSSLSRSAKIKALSLPPNEKLIVQGNFREPMNIRVPMPAWAMRPDEAVPMPASGLGHLDVSDLIDE